MKKIFTFFLAILVLAAVVDGLKPEGPDQQIQQLNLQGAAAAHSHSAPVYDSVSQICPLCSGAGRTTCRVCRGTGNNSGYDSLSPVQKGFSKPYCEGCNGNGWITCGRCHGTGLD